MVYNLARGEVDVIGAEIGGEQGLGIREAWVARSFVAPLADNHRHHVTISIVDQAS